MTPIASLTDLGELIESHEDELLSNWQTEVALLPGAEKLDGPTITDHIPQLLTELSENLKSDRSEANLSLATTMLERSRSGDSKIELFETSLSTLRRNISRLDALIKRVLQDEANLHLTDSPKLEKREFDLWSLVESTIRDLHPIATDSHTTLFNNVPPDMTIFADARLLGQVFQNLISNAIKFTPNGKITVGASTANGIARCWIQDTGDGIDGERLDKIFDKLETDQQPDKRGVGLGLAIVKQIVELHGGTVTVESRVGDGSTFTLEIPQPVR